MKYSVYEVEDTLDCISVDDIENVMDIQVTDGCDIYEMFGVLDVLIYNDEYLCIEDSESLLFNVDIGVEIQQLKLGSRFYNFDEHYDSGNDFSKIELPKEDEWFMGVDSSGYYFGERYDED